MRSVQRAWLFWQGIGNRRANRELDVEKTISQGSPMILLKPVDCVEVLSVMDNSIDVLMGNTPVARRAQRARDSFSRPQLRAEHGVSMLVTIYENGNKDSLLFDTGVTIDRSEERRVGKGCRS